MVLVKIKWPIKNWIHFQIIGGRMSEYFGFKKIYGFGLLLTGFLCFLSPVLSKLNVWAFILLRVFQGIFEGVTFPSLYVMTARWIPLKERNTFIARSFFGTVFGLIITFPLCGFLADAFGWESAFYVIGNSTICDNYTMTALANTIVYLCSRLHYCSMVCFLVGFGI